MGSSLQSLSVALEICPAREAEQTAESPRLWLNAEEHKTFNLAATLKRRLDWLAGRIAAKRLVVKYLRDRGEPPPSYNSLEIFNDPLRRPYCRTPIPVDISLSHCAEGALCALVPAPGRVGADWETIRPLSEGALNLILHPSERSPEVLSSAEDSLRRWTVKEAVLKLLGTGSLNPQEILVSPRDVAPVLFGRARELWRSMGEPEIQVESRRLEGSIISVAFTALNAS